MLPPGIGGAIPTPGRGSPGGRTISFDRSIGGGVTGGAKVIGDGPTEIGEPIPPPGGGAGRGISGFGRGIPAPCPRDLGLGRKLRAIIP